MVLSVAGSVNRWWCVRSLPGGQIGVFHDMTTHSRSRRRARPPLGRDRGSISLFAVIATVALIIIIGLVVDGGGRIQAQQRAQAAAREAARAGGQALQAALAIRGQGVYADTAAARTAARGYLAGAGVSGGVSISNGTVITVDTTETYQPVFLSIIGIGTVTVRGHAQARIVRALNGTER
jgi:hypothetical protein